MILDTLRRIIEAARAIQPNEDNGDAMNVLRCARNIVGQNRSSDEELDSMIDAMESCGQHPWSVIHLDH